MHVVFQGETGGYLVFQGAPAVAISGYVYAVARDRTTYSFDGAVASGTLYVSKSGLANLTPDQYVLLPQVVDADSRIYFLTSMDLQIVEVPDFFNEAVVTSGQSVLLRLNTVEDLMRAILRDYVGDDGVVDLPDIKPDGYYRHVQIIPAVEWIIDHNLGKHPSVEVYDSTGDLVVGSVTFPSQSRCVVTFTSAFSGEAVCN